MRVSFLFFSFLFCSDSLLKPLACACNSRDVNSSSLKQNFQVIDRLIEV